MSLSFPLTQAGLLRLLSHLHEVADDKQTALRGRLQHFQRLKFPPGVNTGRGKPAAYGAGSLVALSVAFEMLQLGMSPEAIVALLNHYRGALPTAAGYAGHLLSGKFGKIDVPDYHVILFDPAALASLQSTKSGLSGDERQFYMNLATFRGCKIKELNNEFWVSRLSLVNTTTLIFRISDYLNKHHGVSLGDFSNALIWWAKEREEEELAEMFKDRTPHD
ncbi:hypothetical protein Sj15T_01610 [Sphingobium sp. TA15]|uniref:Uncharacterized protein n=1 Tax=Sphingobium indicum (strain DSM 16413 / CCM 7287 / MTCC 6362 / UT26 / NBRC 101211 / UT26S) TaxID=452662 RepID=D4YZP0_SPHIU|nr:hypothetical protein [Sphingobium indicum]BAI95822.1 hypothetical protein SJA_C1-09880 [Sphingobium indicum UT26S]BDD65140.1 hypothetical protein Sj15T_01610 [Sphingobium sp. TA15]